MTQSAIDQYRDPWDGQDISIIYSTTALRAYLSVPLEEMEAKRSSGWRTRTIQPPNGHSRSSRSG